MGDQLLRQKKTQRNVLIANKISAGLVLVWGIILASLLIFMADTFPSSPLLSTEYLMCQATFEEGCSKVLYTSSSLDYFTSIINADQVFPGITRSVYRFLGHSKASPHT